MNISALVGERVGRITLIPSLALPLLTNLQLGIVVLIIAYIFDFLTGILASYVETKKGLRPRTKSGYIFESERARQSVVKAVGYMSFILLAFAMETLFFHKDIKLSMISDKHFRVTEIIVGICIGIEAYSVIFENIKAAGFDIVGKVTSMAESIWGMIRKVKGEPKEE